MLDFSEFLKVPATYRFVKLCEYASNKLLFLLFDGSITLSKKTGGDCALHNTYYVVRILPLFFSENKSSSSDFLQTSSLVSIV